MAADLEAPPGDGSRWADDLYRARGDEVAVHRPVFTGDVFVDVEVAAPDGAPKQKTVVVLQHPCALRSNGVDLVPGLLVADVRQHKALSAEEWTRFGRVMPLPALRPEIEGAKRNQAAFFEHIQVVGPGQLRQRIASLSQLGVNLLLQRWVRHNSRVVVPTSTLDEQVSGAYEEADVLEEWCERALDAGGSLADATADCHSWLRQDLGQGETRQRRLESPQMRGAIRRELREELNARYGQ